MIIFVNDEEVNIHKGAKVADAMRAYYAQRKLKTPFRMSVTDAFDNSIALDGELREGNKIYIKNEKSKS
ncbi:MAG: hypothetical protein PHI36_04895 [Bacteroidales bacterium]|nr:hypothetical protein [Bacteroidales bacterium]MDD4575745.1 hypothetical protein [Bacteroidales bacterium]